MDGEVNNRTARIVGDVKRDETQEIDRRDEQHNTSETQEIDDPAHLKELGDRRTQDTNDMRRTQEIDIRRTRG